MKKSGVGHWPTSISKNKGEKNRASARFFYLWVRRLNGLFHLQGHLPCKPVSLLLKSQQQEHTRQ